MTATLELREISKSFGARRVLDGISVSFEAATVTAIVGDNGAGKSSLLKIISGSYRPDHGSIHLHGSDISFLSPRTRRMRGIEMVYQDLALAEQQDTARNIFMGREIVRNFLGQRDDQAMRSAAASALSEVSLVIDDLTRPVQTLSGGQQQGIALARALMFKPHVLLLDEPTAALGAKEVQRCLDLVKRERSRGAIVVLVSHRFNDVFSVADRIVVLKHGRIFDDRPASSTNINETIERIVT